MRTFNPAKRLLAILFSLVAGVCSTAAQGQILGSASLNVERRGHTATNLPDGRVLIVGGENAAGPLDQSEVFDPGSQTFSIVANSAARTDHTATALADGRVLLTGGRDSFGALDSTELFSPATNAFAPGPATRRARAGHTATALADGKILLVGGDADGSAELYDPSSQGFSLLAGHLSVPRAFHGAALLQDGRVLIVGGVAPGNNTALNSAEIFDPRSFSFSSTSTTMQIARGLPTLRVLPDGKVQVIGGDAEWSMEMFNPTTGSFNALAHLPPTSDLFAATLSTHSRAALIATTIAQNPMVQGMLGDQQLMELLDRADHSLTEIPQSNRALVAGGVNSSGEVLNSSMLVAGSAAMVTTDGFRYPPGQTVTVGGVGWLPGETVSLVLHEEPETHPDVAISSVADAGGNFINTDFAPAQGDAGRAFTLTAIGQSSGRTAQTAFSDDPTVFTITVTEIRGNGAACGGATRCENPVHIAGTVTAQGFPGQLSQYQVQIDWGDGTVDPDSTIDLTGNTNDQGTCVPSTGQHCHNFSGTWSSNPDHTYATGGSKTVTIKLYHGQAPGAESGDQSTSVAIFVGKRATTTSVSCNSPATAGQGTICTATVSDNGGVAASAPSGAVTLSTDANGSFTPSSTCALTSVTSTSSACTATYTAASASTHHIGAHYNGTTVHDVSDAAIFNLTVNERATTTAVSCTAPVTVGQGTACTATVTDNNGAGGSAPSGTVTLSTDASGGFTPTAICTLSSPIGNSSSCVSTYTPTSASASIHHIGATYNEASSDVHSGSTATAFDLTVATRHTTTTMAFSPASVGVNQDSVATITVTDDDTNGTKSFPAGTVAVISESGDTITGTCTLASTATAGVSNCQVTVTPTHASTHTITATFAATAIHSSSSGSNGLNVGTRHTITTVAFSPASVGVNQDSVATVTVTDDDANGTKSFPTGTVGVVSDSGDTITGTCTLASTATAGVSKCQVTVTPTHASTHTITATFAATAIHSGSSGNNGLTVNTRHTTTTVAFANNPVVVNQATTVNVTVTDDDANGGKAFPSGTVGVVSSVGSDVITGTCGLLSSATRGVSTCSVTVQAASASIHTITATFSATAIHGSSNGNNGLTVNKRATLTAVSLNPPVLIESQSATVTVSVTDVDVGTPAVPTGTVSISSSVAGDTFTPASSCTLVTGSCAVTMKASSAATRIITAVYNGDTIHKTSTGTNGLQADPHTLTISNLSLTPKGGPPLPAGYKSPGIEVSLNLADILGDQSRVHVTTTAQNVASGCALKSSFPASKSFDQSVVGITAAAFKVWEIGKKNLATAKRKKCKSIELRVTGLSIQAFDSQGLASNILTATVSFCFSPATGQSIACPSTSLATIDATTEITTEAAASLSEIATGALRLGSPVRR